MWLFFAGFPMAVVALGAAGMLDRVDRAKVDRGVDRPLLAVFAGLLVVAHAFEARVLGRGGVWGWAVLRDHPAGGLSGAPAVLSNVASNVPAVLLFKPVAAATPPESREAAWLAPAMSSTLAGNFTVLGSAADLIVVEAARKGGVAISLWDYCQGRGGR